MPNISWSENPNCSEGRENSSESGGGDPEVSGIIIGGGGLELMKGRGGAGGRYPNELAAEAVELGAAGSGPLGGRLHSSNTSSFCAELILVIFGISVTIEIGGGRLEREEAGGAGGGGLHWSICGVGERDRVGKLGTGAGEGAELW